MRILFWTELFWPYIGGVQVLAAKTIPILQGRGYEIAVVSSHGYFDLPDEDVYRGVRIYRFPFFKALAGREIDLLVRTKTRVAELKKIFKPDLVHVDFSDPSVFFHLGTEAAHRAPTLISIHVGLPERETHRDSLLRRTLRSANCVTANSDAILADVRRRVPEITSRSSRIYYGLETPRLAPAPLPFDEPRLLCLGRVSKEKGFDLALSAFGLLAKRFPNLRLDIAGDGPQRNELELQAAKLGLSEVVQFVGAVAPERVPSLMNTATLVLMPSRWEEAFGLVALEAAFMARPVIATRTGGLQEVVQEGQTGKIVDKEDARALADAIVFFLNRREKAREMGEAGRLRAQKLFSIDRYVDDYDALYRKLVTDYSSYNLNLSSNKRV